jgi:hypothetical protein
MPYDYFISSRWRNRDSVLELTQKLRALGKTVYCFFEGHESIDPAHHDAEKYIGEFEALDWKTDPYVQQMFEKDMTAEKNSEIFILLLPAGISAHIEAGAAYGMGKKCIVVGPVEKTESLYRIFGEHYEGIDEFIGSISQ